MTNRRVPLNPWERLYFYVPGYRPGYIENAMTFAKLNIIFCLEDGTPEEKKQEARYLVKHALHEFRDTEHPLIVRINSIYTKHWKADLEEIVPQQPKRIRIPMVNKAEDLIMVDEYVKHIAEKHNLPTPPLYEVMVESREGLHNLKEIARASNHIYAFTMGGEDYYNDCIGVVEDPAAEVKKAKQQLGKLCQEFAYPCFDTTYMDYKNLAGFQADCQFSHRIGFTGRSVIHPDQVLLAIGIYSQAFASVDSPQKG